MSYVDYLKNSNSLIIKDNFVYFNIITKFSNSSGVVPLSSIKFIGQDSSLMPKSLIMTIAWIISTIIVGLILNSLVTDLLIKIIGLSILGLMAIPPDDDKADNGGSVYQFDNKKRIGSYTLM